MNCTCNCDNYEQIGKIGDGYYYYCYKCNDCGREWFEVFALNYVETVEVSLDLNPDWC